MKVRRSKPPMPEKMRARASRAVARHQSRPVAPEIDLSSGAEGWDYGNPYDEEDEGAWLALMLEAFGTRQEVVAHCFINHLAHLCSSGWEEGAGRWRPNEYELQTAIAIVQSMKPKNEAQAALAAQAVAIHFAAMKVGSRLAGMSYPDPRTIASLAALGKVYAGQLETMQKLKGGGKARPQTIKVEKHVHVHHERHVHLPGEGGRDFGSQAHDRSEPRARARQSEPINLTALPSPDKGGDVVPFPSGEGAEPLPQARGR